jgi:hypothetical protein
MRQTQTFQWRSRHRVERSLLRKQRLEISARSENAAASGSCVAAWKWCTTDDTMRTRAIERISMAWPIAASISVPRMPRVATGVVTCCIAMKRRVGVDCATRRIRDDLREGGLQDAPSKPRMAKLRMSAPTPKLQGGTNSAYATRLVSEPSWSHAIVTTSPT